MNKNPFATAAYTPQQPPLPPGPPPPQPAQPDYSAYWAAAAAAQQASAASAYSAQWSASQPAQQTAAATAARPADQAQLYANYGYGANWQQQQQRQQQAQQPQQQHQHQQHFQPPPPVVQPPPPPPPQPQPQPQYNPYQPQAGAYQQPYVPQQAAQAVPQAAPVPFQQAPPQPYQQQTQQFFPQQQQHRPNRQHSQHHGSPQQFPPAKRQRFDGPNQHRGPPPPPPQFQPPPPPPPMQQPGGYGQNPSQGQYGRGGGPQQGGRGGYNAGRGGNMQTRGRGGGSMGMTRGTNRGRGGSYTNMGNRGGGNQGGGGGSFRGQGSNRGGYGNKDNRRGGGGSFSNQGYSHGQQYQQHNQQNYHNHHQNQNQSHSSFRGRGQGFSSRGGRHGDSASTGSRDNVSTTSGNFSSGKRDENKRTLTDFKIVGLKIPDLSWVWGTIPDPVDPSAVKDEVQPTASVPSDAPPAVQPSDGTTPATAEGTSTGADAATAVLPATSAPVPDASAVKAEIEALLPPPPSRVRMYFHTPVSPDDAHPISQSSYASSLPNARKGKRKKLEDDDGDYEEGRGAPPPPPHASGGDYDGAGRDSVAPSVAETTSEGDWLMAAIGEEEGDGEGQENLHVSEVEHFLDSGDAGDGEYGNEYMQGDGHDGDHAMGDEDAQGSEVGPDDEHYTGYVANGTHDATEHPLVNGAGHADALSGSQEHQEGGAVPAAPSQANSNEHSQDSVSSVPALHAPNGSVPPDASSAPTLADASSQSTGTNAEVSQSGPPVPRPAPLQATDSMTTVADTDQEQVQASPYASTVIDGVDGLEHHDYEATQPATQYDESAYGAENGAPVGTPSTANNLLGEKIPSANRLSVSYAGATRRLVIDAEVVPKLKVFRAEGRVEVTVSLMADERGGFRGIAMEGCSEESTYISLELSEQLESDPTVPPLWKATIPSEVQLVLYLDKEKPLSEPRWVKTGDVQEWLRSMFGRMFWVAGDAADGWERRVEVVDPDPAPTIWTLLESWASNSNVGQLSERQRFLRTHMAETDNILEILLRLVRGERSTFTQNAPITPPSVSGPLLSALSPDSAHAAQQTHVSLAVLAIFRLTVEYAKKAAGDKGKGEAEERVGEIIRSLPSHLIYKSLDGIFKEWRVEKKGGRAPPA